MLFVVIAFIFVVSLGFKPFLIIITWVLEHTF